MLEQFNCALARQMFMVFLLHWLVWKKQLLMAAEIRKIFVSIHLWDQWFCGSRAGCIEACKWKKLEKKKKKRGRNNYFFFSVSFDSVSLGCRREGDSDFYSVSLGRVLTCAHCCAAARDRAAHWVCWSRVAQPGTWTSKWDQLGCSIALSLPKDVAPGCSRGELLPENFPRCPVISSLVEFCSGLSSLLEVSFAGMQREWASCSPSAPHFLNVLSLDAVRQASGCSQNSWKRCYSH